MRPILPKGPVEAPAVGPSAAELEMKEVFTKHFNRGFPSFEELQRTLLQFQRETGTSYYVGDSCTRQSWYKATGKHIPEAVKYRRVLYRCIHATSNRKDRQDRRFKDYNCPSKITVLYKDGLLTVTGVDMDHSHPTVPGDPDVYPMNRQIRGNELSVVEGLFPSFHRTSEMVDFVSRHFGKEVTNRHMVYARSRWNKLHHPNSQLGEIEKLLSPQGPVEIIVDDAGNLQLLAFTTHRLQQMYLDFGELIMADATAECNNGAYHLWHVAVMNCHGRGRSVLYGFIANETIES